MVKNIRRKPHKKESRRAQSAVEYLLLLAVVAVIVFTALKSLLPKTRDASESYFNKVSEGIMGQPADVHIPVAFRLDRDNTTSGCFVTGKKKEQDDNWPFWCDDPTNGTTGYPFMTGRYHYGDEKGYTMIQCCKSTNTDANSHVNHLGRSLGDCDDESSCEHESSCEFVCPENQFLTGRWHTYECGGQADENGPTNYWCAQIDWPDYCVRFENCSWVDPYSSICESCNTKKCNKNLGYDEGINQCDDSIDGNNCSKCPADINATNGWFQCPAGRPWMRGRKHDDDENGLTWYYCCEGIVYAQEDCPS